MRHSSLHEPSCNIYDIQNLLRFHLFALDPLPHNPPQVWCRRLHRPLLSILFKTLSATTFAFSTTNTALHNLSCFPNHWPIHVLADDIFFYAHLRPFVFYVRSLTLEVVSPVYPLCMLCPILKTVPRFVA